MLPVVSPSMKARHSENTSALTINETLGNGKSERPRGALPAAQMLGFPLHADRRKPTFPDGQRMRRDSVYSGIMVAPKNSMSPHNERFMIGHNHMPAKAGTRTSSSRKPSARKKLAKGLLARY